MKKTRGRKSRKTVSVNQQKEYKTCITPYFINIFYLISLYLVGCMKELLSLINISWCWLTYIYMIYAVRIEVDNWELLIFVALQKALF
jgi:hypothetical protein